MIFPNLVYRCPGPHQCNGGTYEYLSVQDQDQLDAALKLGYFSTLDGAIKGDEPKEIEKEVSESSKEPLPVKEEEEVSVSESSKESIIDYKSLSWNELRSYAKELEKEKDIEIIKQGSTKESILSSIELVLKES